MATEQYPKVYLYKRIVQAKLFIDDNYAERIDLDNISDEACFSKFHFTRLFKTIYGRTPRQYLIHVRVEKALLLLGAGHSVSYVCHAVGFESLSSFGVLFRRVVGVTPSLFVEGQRRQKSRIADDPLKFVPGCVVFRNGWDEK